MASISFEDLGFGRGLAATTAAAPSWQPPPSRTAERVLGERDREDSSDDDDVSVPFATWFCPSCTFENAKANTACEACGAVRAPTPRERRMSRERAAEAEARRNSEALRDEAAADLSDLSDGDDATVVEAARPTARRRVRAGRPLLLALPPELARRALQFLPWFKSERDDRIARNASYMHSLGLGGGVAGAAAALAQGTYRMRLRAVCFACLELGEERRQRYIPWDAARLLGVRDSRDRDWGHMSRGWRWTFNEATTTLLDAARAPPQLGGIDPALLAAANSLPPRDRRRALRAAAPTAFESLPLRWRLQWQKAMRALCRAKSAAFFADCLRDPATMVAETLSRDATLTMLQRYAIFDRWSAALERACEEVEANLEDWRQNQPQHYAVAERACPTIRSRALAAFRASCIVAPRPGLPRPMESLTRDAAALVPADAFAVAETALAGRPSDDSLFDRVARRLSRDARPLPPSLVGVADALEEIDGADSRQRLDESLRLALRLRVLLPLRAARFAAVVEAAPRVPRNLLPRNLRRITR
jgi:hypothetical protein